MHLAQGKGNTLPFEFGTAQATPSSDLTHRGAPSAATLQINCDKVPVRCYCHWRCATVGGLTACLSEPLV